MSAKFIVEKDWITGAGLRAVCIIGLDGERKRHRCGYVAVPADHPAYNKGYDDVAADVHGGLTYAGGNDKYPVEDPGLWWLGFDCAHYGDVEIEPDPRFHFGREGIVRSLEYVQAECESLAAQLKAMEVLA